MGNRDEANMMPLPPGAASEEVVEPSQAPVPPSAADLAPPVQPGPPPPPPAEKVEEEVKMVTVRAKMDGWIYNARKKKGDTFTVPENRVGRWMEKI